MNVSSQIAKHFREVYFGGNWTWSNLKDTLSDVNLQQATKKVHSFNTIATLVYHIHYYVIAVTKVLEGQRLDSSDKLSFDVPQFNSEDEWKLFLNKSLTDAENFAQLIEKLPENKLWEFLEEEIYGIYYRNLHGIIEHCHYHLGQIVILKKLIAEEEKDSMT